MPVDRAVAVVRRGDHVLVIRRVRDGDDRYAVLPGGGVEPGETPEQAVVRELFEETGLAATVVTLLATRVDGGRVAHYFEVATHGTLRLGGPEALRSAPNNCYEPAFVPVSELAVEGLRPVGVVELLQLGQQP